MVGASTAFLPSDDPASAASGNAKPSTLGLVIKICIEHCFDIFEEHYDRTVGDTMRPSISQSAELISASSPQTPDKKTRMPDRPPSAPLVSSTSLRSKGADSDKLDPDEAMHVIPITPSLSPSRAAASIQYETLDLESFPMPENPSPSKPYRFHRFSDSPSGAERFSSISPSSSSPIGGTVRLPAGGSMISIEGSPGGSRGSGSITIGRGARKPSGAGAGVEAYGVTAMGSFSPPHTSHPE